MYLPSVPDIYLGEKAVQKIYLGEDLVWPAVPYEDQYLTLSIVSGGTLNLGRIVNYDYGTYYRGGFVGDYSINGGPWITSVPAGGPYPTSSTPSAVTVYAGDKIRFRGDYTGRDADSYMGSYPFALAFSGSTCTFNAYGNMQSIIYGDDFANHPSDAVWCAWSHMFQSSKIISAANLVTPGGNYSKWAFFETFYDCPLLVDSPQINCSSINGDVTFTETFYNCQSLKTIQLPYLETGGTFARWIFNVPRGGTFVQKRGAVYQSVGSSSTLYPTGIPAGWTVIEV